MFHRPLLYRLGALLLATLALVVALVGPVPTRADEPSHYFAETGHTVSGLFLSYWNDNGGLAQQGYPISDPFVEPSDLDPGKSYEVQYFERAVFERHPEYAGTPYEVLLSLTGADTYQQKYPDGAPGQRPNTDPGTQVFATGKFIERFGTGVAAGALPADPLALPQGGPAPDMTLRRPPAAPKACSMLRSSPSPPRGGPCTNGSKRLPIVRRSAGGSSSWPAPTRRKAPAARSPAICARSSSPPSSISRTAARRSP